MSVTIKGLDLSAVGLILGNLRKRDMIELLALGYQNAEAVQRALASSPGAAGFVAFLGAVPVATVILLPMNARCLSVGMFATDDWPKVALSVYRETARHLIPACLEAGFTRAECRAIDGHTDAVRFLERLGFNLECRVPLYGEEGETFLQYAYTRRSAAPTKGT